MRISAGTIRLGALVAVMMTASSCTVAVEEGGPPPLGPGPSVCTREYAPVCARRGYDRETFPNACVARVRGYRVVHAGKCRPEGGVRPPLGPGPRVCTREYAPVCARRGARVRTFANACEAQVADYRIVHRGPC